MDPGEVPAALQNLTYVEQQLIARIHPVISVYKLKGMQYAYSGNVINFPQKVEEIAPQLPWRLENLPSIITIRRGDEINYTDFHVCAERVRKALVWLKANNPLYDDIQINNENLNSLPDDGNVYNLMKGFSASQESQGEACSPEKGDEVNDDEEDYDDIEETGMPSMQPPHQQDHIKTLFDWPTISTEPISEFKTVGYIAMAFPSLYPYGRPDLRDKNRKKKMDPAQFFKHLMLYKDGRFAKHPRFRFFAFNSVMRWRAVSQGSFYVSKNVNLKNKTAEELKTYLQTNNSAMRDIMFSANKLRGSKAYWKKKSYELLDMIEQLGLPTLFITLSAADYHWPDLFKILAPDRNVDDLSERERRKLVEENPFIVDDFFLTRVKTFNENVSQTCNFMFFKICCSSIHYSYCYVPCLLLHQVLGPHLGVKDFWYRIEYQHR